jgi:hypothetical protein
MKRPRWLDLGAGLAGLADGLLAAAFGGVLGDGVHRGDHQLVLVGTVGLIAAVGVATKDYYQLWRLHVRQDIIDVRGEHIAELQEQNSQLRRVIAGLSGNNWVELPGTGVRVKKWPGTFNDDKRRSADGKDS